MATTRLSPIRLPNDPALYRLLDQLGIKLTSDGHLELDVDPVPKLDNLLESDFEGVASFVSGVGGFADQFREVADQLVDPFKDTGTLTARISGATDRVADLKKSIERAEERLEGLEASLVQQFAALERTLSQLQEQSNFLASFLAGQSRQR